MLIEETVTYLQMMSPGQLIPGESPPTPVDMEKVDAQSASLLRSRFERVPAPYGWVSRSAWSDDQWAAHLLDPSVRAPLALVEEQAAGVIELQVQADGDVEIVVLGLVPEFVGQGFGGYLLTEATRLAWEISPPAVPTTRVWLHTSSRDHPNDERDYEKRGFRRFRVERRRREVPD